MSHGVSDEATDGVKAVFLWFCVILGEDGGLECFFDTITQHHDGRIYLQAGKSQCNIVRLDGLEAIRRIPDQDFDLQ